MDTSARDGAKGQKAGGMGALYLAAAYLAAMPYFLLVVDYQSASTAAAKVALVAGNYASMYAMYLATYVVFGLALGVVVFALHDRLHADAPILTRIATAIGLLWSLALVMSGMVFTYGMTTIVTLARTDLTQAATAWQAMEPVAQALGGAGGELLGGLWVLLVSGIALRHGELPKALCWLGVLVGAFGLASVVPPLHDAAYAFGLLQIVWFAWMGATLLTTKATEVGHRRVPTPAYAAHAERTGAVLGAARGNPT